MEQIETQKQDQNPTTPAELLTSTACLLWERDQTILNLIRNSLIVTTLAHKIMIIELNADIQKHYEKIE